MKDIADYSDEHLQDIATPLGLASAEECRQFFQTLTHEDEFRDLSMARLRDVAWTVDSLPIFFRNFRQPLYNDHPSAATMLFSDPRFSHSDVVVNYRANQRTLVDERLTLLGVLPPGDPARSRTLLHEELRHAMGSVHDATPFDAKRRMMLLRNELVSSHNAVDIDVNVDAFQDMTPEHLYEVICEHVNTLIGEIAGPTADAMTVLERIAREETWTTNAYARFNNPESYDIPHVQLDGYAPMRDNIETVYQRAVLRRNEFHKMSEPFAVSHTHGRTYSVHFSDPSGLFVNEATTSSRWSKRMYRQFFEREIKPTLAKVIIDGIPTTPLRDIVLIDSFTGPTRKTLGHVVRKGEAIIFHCDRLRKSGSARTVQVIRHEYQHVTERGIHGNTIRRYREMENEDDPSSLFLDTLEAKLAKLTEKIAAQNDILDSPHYYLHDIGQAREKLRDLSAQLSKWHAALQDVKEVTRAERMTIFNADSARGYPNGYARTNANECVAEQRYAMNIEPMRIALLQRMSHHATSVDAQRQKTLYDMARAEMKDVHPAFYARTGQEYGSDMDPALWGLRPGTTKKTDHHVTIMALDASVATLRASENLAATLLKDGSGVALMEYKPLLNRMHCRLQSNLDDVPPGHTKPTVVLHVVGGHKALTTTAIIEHITHTFKHFAPTGRPRTGERFRFARISFERSPYNAHPWGRRVTPTQFLDAFQTEFARSFPGDVSMSNDETHRDIWTRTDVFVEDTTCIVLGASY
eukprot:GEMP01006243.1.p1 GENE.GEMP01006243.1~~GEMP01006243.1.p1  ORF type:complete len:750 (+),score=161.36 GEMP01006243.1:389-2638(+)